MRLIDADALIADLDKGLWGNNYDKALAEAIIQDAPSIDIIRCRDCKYWHKNRKEGDGMNVFDVCYDFQADDFCSYGEREGE